MPKADKTLRKTHLKTPEKARKIAIIITINLIIGFIFLESFSRLYARLKLDALLPPTLKSQQQKNYFDQYMKAGGNHAFLGIEDELVTNTPMLESGWRLLNQNKPSIITHRFYESVIYNKRLREKTIIIQGDSWAQGLEHSAKNISSQLAEHGFRNVIFSGIPSYAMSPMSALVLSSNSLLKKVVLRPWESTL